MCSATLQKNIRERKLVIMTSAIFDNLGGIDLVAPVRECSAFCGINIISDERIPGVVKILRHPSTHVSESNKTDSGELLGFHFLTIDSYSFQKLVNKQTQNLCYDHPTVGVIVHASKPFKIASPPCAKIETPRLSARVG